MLANVTPTARSLPARARPLLWPLLAALLMLLALSRPAPALAAPGARGDGPPPPAGTCEEGVLPSGALWMICLPDSDWNGDMVLWAHGYTAFNEPIDFQNLYLGDLYLPDLVTGLKYGFATTSYRVNGLAILPGADDIRELVAQVPLVVGQTPEHTFLTGASEGGIIGTLLAEQSPELFDGVLAMCGPVGEFRRQLNYFGDGRVLFDYFFPGLIPGDPLQIPTYVIDDWETVYQPAIEQGIAANPSAALELVRTANAAHDPTDFATIENTVMTLAWYSVFATNDASETLNGNPFGNLFRLYRGSSNDLLLNQSVQRVAADLGTLATVPHYQTTGELTIPVVNMHTLLDEQIPYWQQLLYRQKVQAAGAGDHLTTIPIPRYGHCDFTPFEAVGAFALLVFQSTGETIPGVTMLDPAQAERATEAAAATIAIPEPAEPVGR